ncbi:glycosyltransferase [Ulvibacter sp.]|nr:glycosyltransferase [Ulvibacter sp.]
MIFIESYQGIGGGQKILAKIANLQSSLFPSIKSYLILTAPSKEIKDLYNNEIKIIDIEMTFLNVFGDFRAWLNFNRLIGVFPMFLYYQIKLLLKLIYINDQKVFLSDYRALAISIIPCVLTRKKIYFYIIGGSPFNNKVNKFLSKFIFKTFSISDELASDLDIQDYELVRNGIDVSEFSKSKSTIKDNNKFLYVGTLTQNKGLHRLVKALKSEENSDWTLDVFGTFLKDDPYENYLKNLIIDDSRIKLYGFVKNVSVEIKKYSTLIFPSVLNDTIIIDKKKVFSTSSEGSPTIIIEAVLSGLKIIANDVTGVKDLSEVLPNILVFNWDSFIKNGMHPSLIKFQKELNFHDVRQHHKDLFDKSIIDKKLLNNIYND